MAARIADFALRRCLVDESRRRARTLRSSAACPSAGGFVPGERTLIPALLAGRKGTVLTVAACPSAGGFVPGEGARF